MAIESSWRATRVTVWMKSLAVNSPQPSWNWTPFLRWNTHSVPSALVISQDSARPGTSFPELPSVAIRGSAKGRTCWFAAKFVPRQGRMSSIGGGEIAAIKVSTLEVVMPADGTSVA